MDEDLEEALRAAAAEHPPDHQALLDALEAMASEHTTPPTATEHHHDDDLHLGPDIFELLKGEQYNEPERVHHEPGQDTTGAAPVSTPTEPHPAQPNESRHQSQSADLHQDASGSATDIPASHEETAENDQEIMDVLAAMFPPAQPPAPANSEEKDEIKRESPAEERPQSPLKRMRSAEDDTTADQRDEKRVKTDAEHARELEEELKRIFQSASSNPVDSMDTVVADETIEPGDHSMLDADSQIIDHLNGHFGGHEAHDLANGVLDGFHSDFVLEGIDGENTLHTDPNGTPDLTMSETPTHKKSIWDPNPKHFTRQMHYIPTLGTVAYDVLRALSERSFETVIGGINPKENGEETEVFKEYRSLKSFFYELREKISDEFPLLYPDQLDIVDTGEQEILRVANLATICSSIFGANELGWPDLDSNFLLAFAPKSKPMTSEVADLYIGLKTQMYLDLLENEQDANRETLLKRLFVDGVETSLKQRHPDVPLVSAEKDFLANCNARKTLLLEESSDPAKIVELKDQKYPYDSFLQSINVYISNCIETIENLATRRNSISFDMENFSFDDGLDGHDLGDLETLMAEAASRAAQASVDEKETSAAGIDELAALLSDGITRNSQQQQSQAPTTTASGLSPTALALDESALRAKTLALDSIQQNQYRPTVSPQPSTKPTTYHNPQQHQAQPQQPHPPYYQYNQQPAANAQASHNAASSDGDLPPNQTERTPVLYERARQAAAARSSNHARREGSHSTRRPWSADEEKALMMGLDMVKGPHWSQILTLFGPNGNISNILADRTQVQLKDKARNLKLFFLKTSSEMPYYLQCVTGELKTRAPTQAARKEAEEKSRLNSQEEQERINGIMALGNMQTNGAQRSNPALVGQRSATPTQPPQGGLQAHPSANRATQSQPPTPVAGRISTGQPGQPVRYPPTAPKLYQAPGAPAQPHVQAHPLAQQNGQRPSVSQTAGQPQPSAQGQQQQQQGLPQTAQKQHGLPSTSQQHSGSPQGQQQQQRPVQNTLQNGKPQQHAPQYQQRPQAQTQPATQAHSQTNPQQQPQRAQQPVHAGSASVNPQQASQQRPVQAQGQVPRPLGPPQAAPRAQVPGQVPAPVAGQASGQAPRPVQYAGANSAISRPPQPQQPSSQLHTSTQQPGLQQGVKREGVQQQATQSHSAHPQPAQPRPVQNQPVSQQPGQSGAAQPPAQARAPPQSIPSAASQASQGTLRTPQTNAQHNSQSIGQTSSRAPAQTTSQQPVPQGPPRIASQAAQGTSQVPASGPPRANPPSSAQSVPQSVHPTAAQANSQAAARVGVQTTPHAPAQAAQRTAPMTTNQQPARAGAPNPPKSAPRPNPPTGVALAHAIVQAAREGGPQIATQAAVESVPRHTPLQPGQSALQVLSRAGKPPSSHQNTARSTPQPARPNVPQSAAQQASQAPRSSPQVAHAAVPRAPAPQVQSPRLANSQQPPTAQPQAQSQAQPRAQAPAQPLAKAQQSLPPRAPQQQPQAQPQAHSPAQSQAQPQGAAQHSQAAVPVPQGASQPQGVAQPQVRQPQAAPTQPAPVQATRPQAPQPQSAHAQAVQPQQRPPAPLPQQQQAQQQPQQRSPQQQIRQPPSQAPQQQSQQQPRQQQTQAQPSAQPQTQTQAQSQAKPPQPPQQAPQRPLQPPAPQQHQLPSKPPTPQPSSQPSTPQQPVQKTPEQQSQSQTQVAAPASAPTEPPSEQHTKAEPTKEAEPDLDTLFFLKEAMEREQQDARDKEARDKEAEALRVALLAIEGAGGGSGGGT